MAKRASGDLTDRRLTAGEARGIVVSREIAYERGHSTTRAERCENFFQEGGLAGARTRDEAHYKNLRIAESLAKRAGYDVVLLQNIFADFDEPGPCVH
jgi:hypothetical protein